MIQNEIYQFRTLLAQAQKILIALAADCDEDEMAAALALYLLINKQNKKADIVCAKKVKVSQAYLYAVDKIKNTFSGSNNLVVSLPYKEGTIEKVSYNIENNRFNLVIEPRGEGLDFDPNQIEYQYGKGDFDIVITVGAGVLVDLGEVYNKMTKVFGVQPIINIDKSPANTRFGRVNLLNTASASRVVTLVTKFLNMPLDADIASNLMTGVSLSMKKFDLESAKPEDLEAIAYLLRFGAKNLKKKEKLPEIVPAEEIKMPQVVEVKPVQVENQNTANNEDNKKTPEDWLKPKIFTTKKGSTLI